MSIQYLSVSWETYHDLAYRLAATIITHTPQENHIVAISRGGLTLGHILSDFLRVPIATFSIQSYTDIKTHGVVRITEPLKTNINGKSILLVDDVADTGTTLKRAVSYLKQFHPKSITTVTMFYKPKSIIRPDYFAGQTSKWIIFPYEPTESILSITRIMEKDGKTKRDIQDKLQKLGFTEKQIRFTRKYFLS
jgi:hypothetical protein